MSYRQFNLNWKNVGASDGGAETTPMNSLCPNIALRIETKRILMRIAPRILKLSSTTIKKKPKIAYSWHKEQALSLISLNFKI